MSSGKLSIQRLQLNIIQSPRMGCKTSIILITLHMIEPMHAHKCHGFAFYI